MTMMTAMTCVQVEDLSDESRSVVRSDDDDDDGDDVCAGGGPV